MGTVDHVVAHDLYAFIAVHVMVHGHVFTVVQQVGKGVHGVGVPRVVFHIVGALVHEVGYWFVRWEQWFMRWVLGKLGHDVVGSSGSS